MSTCSGMAVSPSSAKRIALCVARRILIWSISTVIDDANAPEDIGAQRPAHRKFASTQLRQQLFRVF